MRTNSRTSCGGELSASTREALVSGYSVPCWYRRHWANISSRGLYVKERTLCAAGGSHLAGWGP